MDGETRRQLQKKLGQRMHLLPSVFQQFLEKNYSSLPLGSRYEYVKDFRLFTDYLGKVFSEGVDDQLIVRLEKQDCQNFLTRVYQYTRSFQAIANQETEQLFENNYYGASRRQYSLNHFLRFLYQKGLIEEEISPLGTSLPGTTKAASRYTDAEFFKDFEYSFILIEDFRTSREVSFEKKDRPKNLAIATILLYCGLKIHEVVELKRKDVSSTKQILNLSRKKNGLSKVPILKETMSFLENYSELATQNTDGNFFVFRSPHDRQISLRTTRQVLSKITVHENVSPGLCRKTYRHYTELYLGDVDAVNYLCDNRYLSSHSFQEVWGRMADFSYHESVTFVQTSVTQKSELFSQ